MSVANPDGVTSEVTVPQLRLLMVCECNLRICAAPDNPVGNDAVATYPNLNLVHDAVRPADGSSAIKASHGEPDPVVVEVCPEAVGKHVKGDVIALQYQSRPRSSRGAGVLRLVHEPSADAAVPAWFSRRGSAD